MKNFNFQNEKAKRLCISCALLLALLAVNTDRALSQTSAMEPQILPPDVWSFMKYGNVPVDMYTGAANVSIPIYTYKDNDFEIPISLDYVSSGFIPNIPAGSVGVGWFLNAGGMITREVNDIPDEYSHPYDIDDVMDTNTTYHYNRPYKYYSQDYRQGYYALHLACNIGNLSDYTDSIIAATDILSENRDISSHLLYPLEISNIKISKAAEVSADIFSFNFMGHRGKFHMSDSEIVVYETTDPKGEYHIDLSGFGDIRSTIKITTGDGYIYTFGGLDDRSSDDLKVEAWYCPYLQKGSQTGDSGAGKDSDIPGIYNQWQLTSIEAPNGCRVNFGYSELKTIETIRPEGRVQHNLGSIRPILGVGENNSLDWYLWLTFPFNLLFKWADDWLGKEEASGWKDIKGIEYKSGVVKYVAKTRQLTSISTNNSRIDFIYNQTPIYERSADVHKEYVQLDGGCTSSYGSDGAPQYTVSTQSPGRLNSVIVRDLINNRAVKTIDMSYTSLGTGAQKKLFLTEVSIPGLGKYQMNYIDGNFPINGTPSVDYWGFYNSDCYNVDCTIHGKLIGNITVGTTYQTQQNTGLSRRWPDFNFSKLGMLETIVYPTGGYSRFEYEPHDAAKFVKRSASSNLGYPVLANYQLTGLNHNSTQEVGGVRIKSVTSFGSHSLNHDGAALIEPEDLLQVESGATESPQRAITKEYYYSPGNVLYFPLYMSYSRMEYDNCSTFEAYITRQTVSPLNLHVFSFDKSHIEYGKVTEKYADGSYKEYSFTTYESVPDIMPEDITGSTNDTRWAKYTGPTYMGNFMKRPISKAFHRGKLKSVISYNSDSVPVAATHYNYDTEEPLKYTSELNHNQAEFYKYLRYTDTYKLESLVETQYFPSATTGTNAVTLTTSYRYNSKGQTFYVVKKYPDGVSETTDIRYLQSNSASAKELSMLDRKMFKYPSRVLKTITEPNSYPVLVDAVDYSYENGKVIGISKALTPTAPDNRDYYSLADYSYDEYGRLREKLDANGIKTTYIWGYKGMYPIAVIENSPGFLVIKNPFTDPVNGKIIIPNEGLSQNQEEYLRNIPGTKVTTYKYKPLVGMIESVDPSGRKTIYEYNSGGNLQYVKDENGYILKKYDYSIE